MAGAIDKKIAEVKKELEDSPSTHLSARNGILNSVALIREFSESRLNALCEKFTSSSGNYSLPQICENLAQQIGPPAVSPSHTPELIQLYSGHQPSGVNFSKELANILDTWTKTWVVSGLIPGAPPVPFSGPLS